MGDLAWLLWGTHRNQAALEAIVGAYRRHIELTDEELDRLEAVMYVRPLYLTCFGYRRNILAGWNEDVFAFSDPDYIEFTATAARAAFHR